MEINKAKEIVQFIYSVNEVKDLESETIEPPPTIGTSINTLIIENIGNYINQYFNIYDI